MIIQQHGIPLFAGLSKSVALAVSVGFLRSPLALSVLPTRSLLGISPPHSFARDSLEKSTICVICSS
jgi:hypothetical protein